MTLPDPIGGVPAGSVPAADADPDATPDGAPATADAQWRRLDARMLVVGPAGSLLRLLPLLALFLITGDGGDPFRLWIAVGAAVAIVLAGVARWATTRYRITPERVELHSGWLLRRRRSLPRDRIRTVDLTAKLLHRAFGLSVVKVGAASGAVLDSAGFDLDAVSGVEADRLRRELLDRSPVPHSPDQAEDRGETIAELDWTWLRYAPLTFSALAGIGAVLAFAFNVVDDLGLDPRELVVVDDATRQLTTSPIWLAVAIGVAAVAVIAAAGSVLLYAERWYGYRLTREADPAGDAVGPADARGVLRVRHGLLTRRSLSVAEHRLRGALVSEPLLLRLGGGAQVRALSTGIARDSQGGTLQPPAPRAAAHAVAANALREPESEITRAPLRRHPRAARSRALVRAVDGAAVPVIALAWLILYAGWPPWLWGVAGLLVVAAVALALDRYRNLGHALTHRHLVARQGSLVRRTVALRREGVVGWTIRQSPFQRRVGLVTLEATTAAGDGGYPVPDVDARDAVALTDAAVPGLVTPFVEIGSLPLGADGPPPLRAADAP